MPQANDQLDELMSSLFAVVRTASKGIERLGIDKASMIVLYSVRELGDARPSATAAYCGLDGSTISRHLKRLEDEELVQRRSDPLDGRAHLTTITDKGAALLESIDQARRDSLREALHDWSEKDQRALGAALTRLAEDLVSASARTAAGLTSART